MRIEHGGRVLAYSADTAPCDALIRLAAERRPFLCEASYLDGEDNPPDLHLTGRDAGEAATKAGAAPAAAHPPGRRLGQREPRRSTRPPAPTRGPVEVVRPGATYEI